MVTQYDNSMPPTQGKNLLYSKIGILDEYVIMSTGEYQFTLLKRNMATDEVMQYILERQSVSGYSSYYTLTEVSNPTWDYNIHNEYYVYSNTGEGIMEILPVHTIISSWAITGIVCVLALAIVFKGAIYPCLRRRK